MLLVAFVITQWRRGPAAMLDLGLFRIRSFTGAASVALIRGADQHTPDSARPAEGGHGRPGLRRYTWYVEPPTCGYPLVVKCRTQWG
ncbi:hypothetical protein [Acrocarpospora sp. B8E8]|uniref:hypothetical protein n=1 Tax=Acrocarpospora sp. B8E8 TaxID=3153572 RepID=UPI00325CCC97